MLKYIKATQVRSRCGGISMIYKKVSSFDSHIYILLVSEMLKYFSLTVVCQKQRHISVTKVG